MGWGGEGGVEDGDGGGRGRGDLVVGSGERVPCRKMLHGAR